MKRFFIFGTAALGVALAACLLLLHTISGRSGSGVSTANNGKDVGSRESGGDIPERLRRALEDRDRQYNEAKIRLAGPASQFTGQLESIISLFKSSQSDVEMEGRINQGAIAMGVEPMNLAQPVSRATVSAEANKANRLRSSFKQALSQYRDDVAKVDYSFYHEFADIYGSKGEKKHAPIPVDRDLDIQINYAILLNNYYNDCSEMIGSGWSMNDIVTALLEKQRKGQEQQ